MKDVRDAFSEELQDHGDFLFQVQNKETEKISKGPLTIGPLVYRGFIKDGNRAVLREMILVTKGTVTTPKKDVQTPKKKIVARCESDQIFAFTSTSRFECVSDFTLHPPYFACLCAFTLVSAKPIHS